MLSSMYFTFLQYRFLRGTSHLFLSTYYLIPLITLLFYLRMEINSSEKGKKHK